MNRLGSFLLRRWWIPTTIVFLFAAYTAAGFWLVPYLSKREIVNYVETQLKRRATIGEITFNPFTFVIEFKNFALRETDGSPLASFSFLHVDFELSTFMNGSWTFKEIRVDRPEVDVRIANDGSLNLAKLAPPSAPEEKPAAAPQVLALRIGTFAMREGRVALEDASRAAPFATTLTPIAFTLNDFRTEANFQNAYSFEAATTAGERLSWSGQFSVQPFGSAGKFSVGALRASTIASYLQDALPFLLTSGSLDLDGDYRVAIAEQLGLTLQLPSVKLHQFGITPRGEAPETPWVGLPETTISGIAVSLPEGKVAIERVEVADAKLIVWREPDGQPNLMKFVPAAAPAPASAGTSANAPPFAISVGTVSISNATIDAEDRAMRPATKVSLAPVSLTVTGYTSSPDAELKLDASVTVNGKGKIAAKGDVKMLPLTVSMDVDTADLDLTPLRPYIAQVSGVELLSGQVSSKSKIVLNPAPARGQSGLRFTGDVTVANFATRDAALRQDLVKWQSLRVSGIDFRQGPDSLSIVRVQARRPFGKLVVSADQQFNVVTALQPPGAATPTASASPPPQAAKSQVAAKPMPIRIREIAVEDGTADFTDLGIQPNFAAAISQLTGTIGGLSSDPNSRAAVKLTGSVDRYAPVDITGTVNLLSATAFTDIAMNFRNMELTSFNPYSGKYAGYNISKGKLTTELRYKVENRKLDAQHHVVLDQLEFGQATDSKDAVPLPVRLAVALLKDRDGVINLDLPVSGSLDDPQFQIGPVIWQVVINVLTRIVEAPFALIGSLFGGGDEVGYVDFAAGSAMLTAAERDKIGKVASGLAERPELRLDIPLKTLTEADDAKLAEGAFDEALGSLLPMGAEATPPQRVAALAQLYQQQFGMPPAYPPPPAPPMRGFDPVPGNTVFLEGALRPKFPATEAMRDRLARARAEAVRDAVLSKEGVVPERVFLSERESGEDEAGDVRMKLDLQ